MNSGLKKRLVTGVILALSVIAAVSWLPLAPLALVLGAVVTIAAWEWSRLMGLTALWGARGRESTLGT